MSHQNQSVLSRFTMYFTFLLDLMGYFVVLPIFAPLLLSKTSPWQNFYSYEWRCGFFAFLIFIYAFSQWVGLPLLTSLTSLKGKKPILLLALSLCLLAYLVTAFGVLNHNLKLLFVGRLLSGFFSGNSYLLAGEKAADARIWPILAGSFGLLLGPLLIGILADASLHQLFFNALPFWLMAVLLLVNIALAAFLKESKNLPAPLQLIGFWGGFSSMFSFWKNMKWRLCCSSLFFYFVGWFIFIQFMSAYLLFEFQFSESAIGFSFAFMGVFWCLALFLEKRTGLLLLNTPQLFGYALFILAFLSFLLIFFYQWSFFIVTAAVMISLFAYIWTHMGGFFNGFPEEDNADALSQFVYSCSVFSVMVSSIVGGIILICNFRWLYVVAGTCFLLSGFFYTLRKMPNYATRL